MKPIFGLVVAAGELLAADATFGQMIQSQTALAEATISSPDRERLTTPRPDSTERSEHVASVTALRAELRQAIKGLLPDDAQTELPRRERHAWLLNQANLLESAMTQSLAAIRNHPLVYKRNSDVLNPTLGDLKSYRGNTLGDVGASSSSEPDWQLAKWEQVIAGQFGQIRNPWETKDRFTDAELLEVLLRLERSKAVNDRAEVIRSQYRATPTAAADFSRFQRDWDAIITSFTTPAGWERWDPTCLSHEKHDGVMKKFDQLLRGYEEKLKIVPARPDSQVVREVNSRAEELRKRIADVDELDNLMLDGGATQTLPALSSDVRTVHSRNTSGDLYEIFRKNVLESRVCVAHDGKSKTVEMCHRNGQIKSVREYVFEDGQWIVDRYSLLRYDGTPRCVSSRSDRTLRYFSREGKEIGTFYYTDDSSWIAYGEIITKDGKRISTYDRESKANPSLTSAEYMKLISTALTTPDHLQMAAEAMFFYQADPPGREADYMQLSSETIRRIHRGQMLGDCEDWGAFFTDLKIAQGCPAHIVGLMNREGTYPMHAATMWIEKSPDGRYHGFSVCTEGYDWDGNHWSAEYDTHKELGYATPREALNAVMAKYRYPALGLPEGQAYTLKSDMIDCIRRTADGKLALYKVDISELVQNRGL